MPIKTGHDPFARLTIMKRQVRGDCAWCGGTDRRGKVYQYFVHNDDSLSGRTQDIQGVFCGVECLNTYHRMGG